MKTVLQTDNYPILGEESSPINKSFTGQYAPWKVSKEPRTRLTLEPGTRGSKPPTSPGKTIIYSARLVPGVSSLRRRALGSGGLNPSGANAPSGLTPPPHQPRLLREPSPPERQKPLWRTAASFRGGVRVGDGPLRDKR